MVFGWFCVRLSGVYLAMLTLAFAQIAWSVAFQWVELTGGDNGILGVWPSAWAAGKVTYYYLALALCVAAVLGLRAIIFSPFGYALRAGRDSPVRAEAIGLDVARINWAAFAIAAVAAGMAGGLYAYFKGSVFPTYMAIPKSVDALLMVLLGGVQTVSGPIVGAFAFAWLQDWLVRAIAEYWRFVLGAAIVVLVLAFPQGLVGGFLKWRERTPRMSRWRRRRDERASAGPVLEAQGLEKAFGGVKAVDGVSFGVEAGRLLALIGPNGAGKTTCFNLLNGQLAPDAGRVLFAGRDITGLAPRTVWALGVGRTFQITATFASMTVRENVQMALLSHHGRRGACSAGRARRSSSRPTRCWGRSAWRPRPSGRAACSPTATSSASSWRWRSPTRRSCC